MKLRKLIKANGEEVLQQYLCSDCKFDGKELWIDVPVVKERIKDKYEWDDIRWVEDIFNNIIPFSATECFLKDELMGLKGKLMFIPNRTEIDE